MSVKSGKADLIVNGRRYSILGIDQSSSVEQWAFCQVFDSQTGLRFRVAEFAGSEAVLEGARAKARKLARLRIPGVPLVYDVCGEQEKLFVVTDWVRGLTLREYLTSRRGPAQDDLEAMVEYGRRLCTVLSQLHPAFVHRGLRPGNIVFAGHRVALTELGFSCMPVGFEQEKRVYRAPEQTAEGGGEAVGCWTDIYSFGLIFAEMLTGICHGLPGVQATGAADLPGAWTEVPAELKEIVLHCSQSLPKSRPKNIDDVKRRLSEWLLYRKARSLVIPEILDHTDKGSGLPEPAATLTEAARTSGAAGDAAGKNRNGVLQRLKDLAGKRGLFVVVASLLLMSSLLFTKAFYQQRPAAPVSGQTAPAGPLSGVGRHETCNLLFANLQEFNGLLTAYTRAKVPGSPEKTVQNYRSVETGAKSLRLSLSGFAASDGDLAEAAALQLQMVDSLQNAAGIFADYLEGRKKITTNIDWVEEADRRYRKAQELRAQVAVKLSRLRP